jgi:regulator of cell morphogenesis and NO signaling
MTWVETIGSRGAASGAGVAKDGEGAVRQAAFDGETKVAELARSWPAAIRVFQQRGIDFCCGGNQPLREACERRGLAVDDVLSDLRRAAGGHRAVEIDWNARPVIEIVGHILARYHAGLRDELARLGAMARRAADRHGSAHGELVAVRDLVERLAEEMRVHLDREERAIFPALLRDDVPASAVAEELADAEREHACVGGILAALRAAASDYGAPPEACNTWRGLYHGLAELERDTHLHVHLENNVLFPKVLSGDSREAAPRPRSATD